MRVRRLLVVVSFAALAIASAGYIARSFHLSVDVTKFLIDAGERDLGAVAFALSDSSRARTILLAVAAPDVATALAASDRWAGRLATHPEVAELRAGPDPDFARVLRDLYFPRRLLFLSPEPERDVPAIFSPDGLRDAARRLRAALASPEGMLIEPLAAADPLLAFPAQLRRIESAQGWSVRVRDGRFLAERAGDLPRAILLLTTTHSPFDSTAQAPLLEFIAKSFAELNRSFGGVLELEQSGAHRFAVESERRAKSDATWLSMISLVLLVAGFYVLYHSLFVLALSLIPLAIGLLGATALTLTLFGELHALTLGFGGTLIGICADYPLHLLTHCAMRGPGEPIRAVVRHLRVPLLLAAGTTATGFLVLASADLPGIREVGVFALVGVGLALLSTLVLLPELIPASLAPTRDQVALTAWLERVANPSGRPRWIALCAAGAAIAVCAAGLPRLQWDDDVFALNVPLRPEWLREDAALRERLSLPGMDQLAIAIGADDEAALRLDARVSKRLREAQSAGWIEGFRSVQDFIWSEDLQERNRRALRAVPHAAERLAEAFEAEGFRADAFRPFSLAVSSDGPAPLTIADLFGSPLRPVVSAQRVELADGRVALITALRGVRDEDALAARLQDLPDVHLFDAKRFASDIYARYRARSLRLVAVGALAVLAVLALRYRRIDRIGVAAAPALLGASATLGLLSLAGLTASLMHLLGVLLVLCLGVDYGIFLVESRSGSHEDDAATLQSVVINCLTTLLSFGLLSFSSFPALSALGTSTSLGVCLSLLLVLAFRTALPARAADRGGRS